MLVAARLPLNFNKLLISSSGISGQNQQKLRAVDGTGVLGNSDSNKELGLLLQKIAEKRCKVSFEAIFSEFSSLIYSYGLKNQLSESLARDLVQDVMTTVWLKSSLFCPQKGKAKTWIYTIARNLRFDYLRSSSRDQKAISSEDLWSLESSIADDSDLEQSHFFKELESEIDHLPEGQRKAVESVYIQGLTHEEYANKIKVPLGTVKSRLRLAKQRLSIKLKPYRGFGEGNS